MTSNVEYNEYEDYTTSELQELYIKTDERLEMLLKQPINYYSAGYCDTYLASCSQMWGQEKCREDMRKIQAEIDRRNDMEMKMDNETNKTYVCITECINTGHIEVSSVLITSLEEAKTWISDNSAGGCYRIHNFDKIIEINESGETEQVYMRRPEYRGDWYQLW